ncbi:Modular serine protease, partial [Gryllus bimaculatus]
GGGDLEVRDCRRRDAAGVTVDALLGGVTRMQRLRERPPPPPLSPPRTTWRPWLRPRSDNQKLALDGLTTLRRRSHVRRSVTVSVSCIVVIAPFASDYRNPAGAPLLAALTLGPRRCDACLPGEVCVALAGETLPACRPPADAADPTGCGGLCRLGRDLCHRLDRDAFRCVEDSPCLAEEWRCGNLLCIPRVKRCDGHLNCYDHTDEFDCECDLETHFHCGNGTSCLPRSKRCDHIIDCWDGTDELNCTQACPRADQFTCSDGQCIPRVRFCDGLADCHDQSDEPFGCGGACKRHEWRCGNGRCVKKAAVCDGADDCGDETDEANCSPSRLRLRASQPLVNAK